MLFSPRLAALLALALTASSARAHGVITNVAGANGVAGQAFGVIASTPRDGSTPVPFEQDTSIIRNQEIQNGKAGVCGRTKAGGNNDVATQLDAAVTSGLPSAAADGSVSMTLHQVNQDGAGPYTCEVSTDATGASFAAMVVSTDVPGRNSLSNAKATDFPLVAQMPAGTTCTGGASGNACLVRCRNAALAGPFGGCVAVTTSNATSSASASTAVADVSAVDTATDTDTDTAAAADATATADISASTTAADAALTSAAAAASASADTDTDTDTAALAAPTAAPAPASPLAALTGVLGKAKGARPAGLKRVIAGTTTAATAASPSPSTDAEYAALHAQQVGLAQGLGKGAAEHRVLARVRRSRIFGRQAF